MKHLTLIAFLFGFIISAQAQTYSLRSWDGSAMVLNAKTYADVEGSPYYEDDWQPGLVYLNSGDTLTSEALKLNSEQNQLLFTKNNQLMAVAPNTYNGFSFIADGDTVYFKKGFQSEEQNIRSSSILRVIHKGSVQIVIAYEKEFRKDRTPDPLSGERTDKYI